MFLPFYGQTLFIYSYLFSLSFSLYRMFFSGGISWNSLWFAEIRQEDTGSQSGIKKKTRHQSQVKIQTCGVAGSKHGAFKPGSARIWSWSQLYSSESQIITDVGGPLQSVQRPAKNDAAPTLRWIFNHLKRCKSLFLFTALMFAVKRIWKCLDLLYKNATTNAIYFSFLSLKYTKRQHID